jgi:antitoxin component HigA of HigAB toxin-antitoxin module
MGFNRLAPAPITSDEEHAVLLAELTEILERDHDPDPASALGQRLQALATAIVAYEEVRWPI